MPIEIKELHIRATVVDKKSNTPETTKFDSNEREKFKAELLKSCVQEVLQILKDKEER